jgi:polysaccharide export outer membrane protein
VAVDGEGVITYPFLGNIPVNNLTVTQVESLLRERLAQGYVKDPQVSVSVKQYNSKKILVFGEVAQPGLYKLKGNIPVLEMLFLVNGVKPDAKRMTIIRQGSKGDSPKRSSSKTRNVAAESARAIEVNLTALLAQGDLSQNVLILPGDTIYVSSGTGQKYYVLGQVRKPGPYEWVQDITVLEAIKLADGGTEKAALNRIRVRKTRGNQEETFKVNVVQIMRGKKKDDVIIKPGDVIIVPESWI